MDPIQPEGRPWGARPLQPYPPTPAAVFLSSDPTGSLNWTQVQITSKHISPERCFRQQYNHTDPYSSAFTAEAPEPSAVLPGPLPHPTPSRPPAPGILPASSRQAPQLRPLLWHSQPP